ncbi:hypothetical protein V6Z12_A10G182800 [Gossypium hirsutum]|uniref:Uncharacterized protein n=1 Tax=Gossypium darwinii TaxID=34276 RepID=A0A5D2F0Z2_GOSDA|nr:hypothetical protein ES288_A10G190800v1 [Gossypium darwinii]
MEKEVSDDRPWGFSDDAWRATDGAACEQTKKRGAVAERS